MQMQLVHLPDPHHAIPANFALPSFTYALYSMSVNSAIIADCFEAKNDTITAHVRAMLIAASQLDSQQDSDAIVVANTAASSDENEGAKYLAVPTSNSSAQPSPFSSPSSPMASAPIPYTMPADSNDVPPLCFASSIPDLQPTDYSDALFPPSEKMSSFSNGFSSRNVFARNARSRRQCYPRPRQCKLRPPKVT
jgi:hypothetical protein